MVAAITPGPSNIMLTAAGANAGVLRGLPCLLGGVTGMGAMMFLVPLGLGSLVLRSALVLKALHWGGAAVLLWLSWKIASSRRLESESGGNPVGYGGAAAFQWINPKSWLVSASAAGTFLSADGGSAIAQSAFLAGSSSPARCRAASCGWWSARRSSGFCAIRAACGCSTSRWGRCSPCRSS